MGAVATTGGTNRLGSLSSARVDSSVEIPSTGNNVPAEDCGGERYVDKSFGNGGTGGTSCPASGCSLDAARDATRSFKKATSPDCDASLPTLLRLALLVEWRPDWAEIEVRLVPADIDPESLELVVGVLVYVVDEAEPRLAV